MTVWNSSNHFKAFSFMVSNPQVIKRVRKNVKDTWSKLIWLSCFFVSSFSRSCVNKIFMECSYKLYEITPSFCKREKFGPLTKESGYIPKWHKIISQYQLCYHFFLNIGVIFKSMRMIRNKNGPRCAPGYWVVLF